MGGPSEGIFSQFATVMVKVFAVAKRRPEGFDFGSLSAPVGIKTAWGFGGRRPLTTIIHHRKQDKGWMKKAMLDLDETILDLKRNGKSLREIGSVLQISHEAARKRLKALAGKNRLSTRKENKGLTASTSDNELESTSPNPHLSRLPEDSEMCVNPASTSKAPSHTLSESVNPLETLTEQPTEAPKGVFQGGCSEIDDLFEAIKDFLESKGVQIYNMQNGGYQVKGSREIVRFYITRRDE